MILMYNMDVMEAEDLTGLMTVLNGTNEPWRQLGIGDVLFTVESLLGDGQGELFKGPEDAPNVAFMLIDSTPDMVEEIVSKLREHKVNLPYKAVVTDNNRQWLLGDLIKHIIDEDREVRAVMQLQRVIEASAMFTKDKFSDEVWAGFSYMHDKAKTYISSLSEKETTPDEAEQMLKEYNEVVLELFSKS